MCTVLLRFAPGTAWPVLLGAVRDEFLGRPWDPPDAHWPGVVGGRDRIANGTWLAVRPAASAVAVVLNGARLGPPTAGVRPSRGLLPLRVLADHQMLGDAQLAGFDGFHLLLATPSRADVWSWDGWALTGQSLAPGDHIIVNSGVDADDDPLVPHFMPLLRATPTPDPRPGQSTEEAWGRWVTLLAGDGLPLDDPRALVVRREFGGEPYGSGSASLVALGSPEPPGSHHLMRTQAGRLRYDFTADPVKPAWAEVALR